MKAIILERRDGFAAALREDGVVVRTRHSGEVGETIELEAEIVRVPARRRWTQTAVAAALAVVILGGAYTYMAVPACAYVSLDVGESSVELAVNRLGRVVSVNALNDGTETLAETLRGEVRGRRADDALSLTVERLSGEEQDAVVIAGVTADTEKRGATLTEAVENAVTQSGNGDTQLYTLEVTRDEREQAREMDMGGGRYLFERREPVPPPEEGENPAEGEKPETPTQQGDAEAGRPGASRPPEEGNPAEDPAPAGEEKDTPPDAPDAGERPDAPADGGMPVLRF